MTLHEQSFILAHFNVILGKGIFVGHKLLQCCKVLVLRPRFVTGVGQHIHVAVVALGEANV